MISMCFVKINALELIELKLQKTRIIRKNHKYEINPKKKLNKTSCVYSTLYESYYLQLIQKQINFKKLILLKKPIGVISIVIGNNYYFRGNARKHWLVISAIVSRKILQNIVYRYVFIDGRKLRVLQSIYKPGAHQCDNRKTNNYIMISAYVEQ